MTTQRFPIGKFGPTVNPVGEYVRLDWNSRLLLGEVIAIDGDMATVRHFNGEPWPINPSLSSLEWIRQEEA